jgi:hypothetical protein
MNGTQAATNNGNTGGLLGADLNQARLQADYFRFFNLEQIEPAQHLENGEQLLAFKPSGAAFRDLKGTLLVRSELPTLPAMPSAAYLVVNGTSSAWEATFSSSNIKLTNETQENRPALVIEIRGKWSNRALSYLVSAASDIKPYQMQAD